MILQMWLAEKRDLDFAEEDVAQDAGAAAQPPAATRTGTESKADAQAELRALQRTQGNLQTAEEVITEGNIWNMDALRVAVAPLWDANTHRVTTVKTPDSALKYEVEMALGGWQKELKGIMEGTLHSRDKLEDLGLWGKDDTDKDMLDFVDLILWLARVRAQALCHHSEEPPRLLAALHSTDPEQRRVCTERALSAWTALLDTETLHRNGRCTASGPFAKVVWRFNRWTRAVLSLIERGDHAAAKAAVETMFKGFGDEKLIEDVHQHLRDLDGGQRQFKRSPLMRMDAMLHSEVLEKRGFVTASPSVEQVAHAERQMDKDECKKFRDDFSVVTHVDKAAPPDPKTTQTLKHAKHSV